MGLTRKQISLIHVAKSRLCLGDEQYRSVLLSCGGVESSRELQPRDFDTVMTVFEHMGFQSDFSRRNLGHRDGMASPAQVSLIRDLWSEYTDGKGDDASLGKWLERTFKVSSVRFVTYEIAPKAIAALKAMKAKKAEKSVPADSQNAF